MSIWPPLWLFSFRSGSRRSHGSSCWHLWPRESLHRENISTTCSKTSTT
jgi:hypothetical protein